MNVVPITANTAEPELVVPKHFTKPQKAAWTDLVGSTDKTFHVKQHRFTFEIAAMLLAKMRGGKSMTATESKELKKQMVTLGLATDDAPGPRKSKKNDEYFTG